MSNQRTSLKKSYLIVSLLLMTACAPSQKGDLTEFNENDFNDSQNFSEDSSDLQKMTLFANTPSKKVLINQSLTLRYNKAGVLESRVVLPEGTQLEIPQNYEVKYIDYRTSSGSIERSSTGFIYPVKVVSVNSKYQSSFPASKIKEINNTQGGIYVSASIMGSIEGVTGNFSEISAAPAGAGFKTFYQDFGKPKVAFTRSVTKRFGSKLNNGVAPESLSEADRQKYQAIYAELVKAVNRKTPSAKSYLMMNKQAAIQASLDFEKYGTIQTGGAWTIATEATAVRHGFPNVPCAEFQSELLRQAYTRAGYRVTDDFNNNKGNPLIWSNSAAVANFSMGLFLAGWTPWDPQIYKPMTGAFLMHGSGISPGHTYIAAGDDGMIIVDNGAPQGKDLRKASAKSIEIQFQTGVFFLPPGIIPQKW